MASWLRTNPSEAWWEPPHSRSDPILLVLPQAFVKSFLNVQKWLIWKKAFFSRLKNICRKSSGNDSPSQATLSSQPHGLLFHSVSYTALCYWCHFLPLLVQSRGLKSGGSLFRSLPLTSSVALSKSPEFFELLCTHGQVIPLQHPIRIEIIQVKQFPAHAWHKTVATTIVLPYTSLHSAGSYLTAWFKNPAGWIHFPRPPC